MFPSLTSSFLLPAKTGSPLQHSLKLPCRETFLFIPAPWPLPFTLCSLISWCFSCLLNLESQNPFAFKQEFLGG